MARLTLQGPSSPRLDSLTCFVPWPNVALVSQGRGIVECSQLQNFCSPGKCLLSPYSVPGGVDGGPRGHPRAYVTEDGVWGWRGFLVMLSGGQDE